MKSCATCGKETILPIAYSGKSYCQGCYKLVVQKAELESFSQQLIVGKEMSDEELTFGIAESLKMVHLNQSREDASKSAFMSEDPIVGVLASGLETLSELNKVIVRQNELILRELRNRNLGKAG
jgi:hypothetical protein